MGRNKKVGLAPTYFLLCPIPNSFSSLSYPHCNSCGKQEYKDERSKGPRNDPIHRLIFWAVKSSMGNDGGNDADHQISYHPREGNEDF